MQWKMTLNLLQQSCNNSQILDPHSNSDLLTLCPHLRLVEIIGPHCLVYTGQTLGFVCAKQTLDQPSFILCSDFVF